MLTVYRLREDSDYIAKVQRATLTTKGFGIQPTHGLFGSQEWWSNIETNALPTVTVRGSISRIYMGSMNDWPEFEVTESDGSTSKWSRYALSKEFAQAYAVGRPAEIDYVVQRFRPSAFTPNGETKIVLEVRIGEAT